MKHFKLFFVLLLSIISLNMAYSQASQDINQGMISPIVIHNGDSMPYFALPIFYCYPKIVFKDKKQEEFYWRTVRDVKAVLPLSKYIRGVVGKTNEILMGLPNKASRDNYMKNFEKRIYKENEARFRQLTLNQGKLLIRLVEKETNYSSYELIKAYRGSFRAGLWQFFAQLFGANLKSKFGTKEEDAIIERIIILVEAEQL